jgi:hypothetical protein
MNTNQLKPSFLPMAILVLAWTMVAPIIGCQKEALEQEEQQEERLLQNMASAEGAETRPGLFGPVAATFGCLGYNVNFTPAQPVTFKETRNTDADGDVHYTRVWSVAGLTARATLPDRTAYLLNGVPVTFDVIAGVEMFSIKNPNTTTSVPSPVTSGEVFIHQGTIILENNLTKEKVVIRHVVIKNPGRGIIKDDWYVQGQECS